jgi:hypothetical protein
MVGDLDAALSRSGGELDALPLPSKVGCTAVDLGAGFGSHAIPLARRGFSVVAMDTCDSLLQELEGRKESLPISTVNADLLAFREHVAASLSHGGLFVATFRDYVSAPLQGDVRFIFVRSDADRILTCFLEYADTTVTVHDLLHQREGGSWRLSVSSYSKLRLSPQWVIEHLSSLGLSVHLDAAPGGMIRVTARKPGLPGAAEAGSGP